MTEMTGLWKRFKLKWRKSHEPHEPPHVHVDRDDQSAKFWLDPVALARNLGFSARELNRIQAMVDNHREDLLEAWHGYFGA